MRHQTIMAGLMCLNLGLLCALGYVWKQRRTTQPGGNADAASATVISTNVPRWVKMRRAGETESSSSSGNQTFGWRHLQSRDFKQFVANLRGVECPEETVKDIVVAEINRQFAPREAALKARPEHFKPWESETRRGEPDYERRRKLRDLVNEKRMTLKELLGYDVPVEYPPALAGRTYDNFEKAFLNLPEDKREKARAIMEGYWSRQDALSERTKGFWEPEDREEQQKIQRERRDELAKLLTPDQFIDFELGTSSRASSLRSQLSGFEPNDKEFRDIFKLKQILEDVPQPIYDPTDQEGNRRRSEVYSQANQRVEEQIKTLLGEQRYADYQRSQDYNFRNLTQIAQQNGLPRESAIKAYEAQRFAQQEVAKVYSNPQYNPEQRNETLRSMQQELDTMMTGLLGEQGYQRFQSYGGARIFSMPRPARVTRTIINADGSRSIISE